MLRFLSQRLLVLIPVLLGVSMLSFLLLYLIPGHVVDIPMGEERGARAGRAGGGARGASPPLVRDQAARPVRDHDGLPRHAPAHGGFAAGRAGCRPPA